MSSLASACMMSEQASATCTHCCLFSSLTAAYPGATPSFALGGVAVITGARLCGNPKEGRGDSLRFNWP